METKGFRRLDRDSILETLETRLSATATKSTTTTTQDPQIQLFRVDSPRPGEAEAASSTPRTSPPLRSSEEKASSRTPQQPKSPDHRPVPDTTSILNSVPSDDPIIQGYNKRIQVMQSIIEQLRATARETQRREEAARRTQVELEKARLRIMGLEDEVEELRTAVERADGYRRRAEDAEVRCCELEEMLAADDRGPGVAGAGAGAGVVLGRRRTRSVPTKRQLARS